jgi:endonuclease G
MIKKHFPTIILGLTLSFNVVAAPTNCSNSYYQQQAPDIGNNSLAQKTRELCNTDFATMHSGLYKIPLWSAQLVTREHVIQAKALKRIDSFRPDTRLPPEERSELADYEHSGFDRGHIVPNGNSYTKETQYETFLLSNMIPQDQNNNRGIWAEEESIVRKMVLELGSVYTVSGVILQQPINFLNNRVAVPAFLYKAILDPVSKKSAVYLNENQSGNFYKVISVDELKRISNIDVFPGLTPQQRANQLSLPNPNNVKERS